LALGVPQRACGAPTSQSLPDRLVRDAAIGVSALAQAQPGRRLLAAWLGRDLDQASCSPWQERALRRLSRCVENFLPAPDDINEKDALSELLHSDDLYSVSGGAALGSYDPLRLRVTKADLCPKEIEDLVSAEAAVFIRAPHRYIIKTDDELRQDADDGAMAGRP